MAVVVAKLNDQLEALENLMSRQESIKNNIEFIFDDGKDLNIQEITNYKDYLGKVIVDAKNQEQVIEQTRYSLKFKQFEVQEALKEVKILEKLKETQEKKYYQNYEYIQAREIDDIASTRYKKVLI